MHPIKDPSVPPQPFFMHKAAPKETVAEPLSAAELCAVFGRPHRILDVVLTGHRRLACTVAQKRELALLSAVLLLGGLLLPLPYGTVLAPAGLWRVSVLFVGSLFICLPSLHVFAAYLGVRVRMRQTLCLALIIPCVAGLFTFAFFPILWFMKATLGPENGVVLHLLSAALLAFSFFAGVVHLRRCTAAAAWDLTGPVSWLLLLWSALLIFVAHRMAGCLELWP